MADESCTFCDVIARRLPGTIRYEDDEIVVFDNHLDWVPVMLLLAPRRHMSQEELWRSGPLMSRIASLAVRMGREHAPNGFRLLSNFGHDALQTQPHGHLHVIGGTYLGLYVRRPG
jgi:histidine triad (HIT) family protein